jgi:cytochrome c556
MFLVASILAVVTVGAMAQADRPDPRAGEYRAWMQSIPPAVRSLTANINGRMGDMAAADADKLDDTFKQIEDFWGQRNVQDAVAFTQTARKALTAISKDAKAGNTDAAMADLKTLQSTCGGCHMAHRDGSAGSFSIK